MARPSLFTHRKLRILTRLIGCKARAIGSLELIWNAAYSCGDARLGSAPDVEAAAEWQGTKGKLVESLCKAGFLDALSDGDYAVHDLFDNAPDYVRKRYQRELKRRTASGQRPVSDRSVSSTPAPTPTPVLSSPESSQTQTPTKTLVQSQRLNGHKSLAPGGKVGRSPLVDAEKIKTLEENFTTLYGFYPRHVGKEAAWKAFQKLDPDVETLQAIARDVKRRVDSGEWIPTDPEKVQYILHLSTYLNQRRWTDERI